MIRSGNNTFAAGRAFAAIEYDRKGVPRKSDDITANLKRRARRLAVDGRVDGGTRSLIRHALETRDPYLVQLVTRVERGEMRIDHLILDTDQVLRPNVRHALAYRSPGVSNVRVCIDKLKHVGHWRFESSSYLILPGLQAGLSRNYEWRTISMVSECSEHLAQQ